MAYVESVRINGQVSSDSSSPVIKLDPVTITWDYESESGLSNQSSFDLKISSNSHNWGNSLFVGSELDISEDSTASSYEYVQYGLTRGTSYYCQIRITDNLGDSTPWYKFSFAINRLPFVTGYRISPSSPSSSDHLDLIYAYDDSDGHDQSGTKIRWFRNNLPMIQYDDLCTLPSSATNPSDSWTAKIIPSDGLEFGGVVETQSVTISSIDSTIATASLLPNDANVDDILKVDYSISDDEYIAFSGTVSVEWYVNNDIVEGVSGEYARISLDPGDEVYAIVKLSDGESTISQKVSNTVTISDVDWHIDDLLVSGLTNADNLAIVDPILSWNAYKTTSSSEESPNFLRVIITKTWSLDGPIYDTGYTEYFKDSHAIPSGILTRGEKYYIHIGVGDSTPIDDDQYKSKQVSLAGSAWSESVSNSDGWTIEFKAGILLTGDENHDPNIGIYVHDGSRFCSVILGLRTVTFLSDTSIIYTYGQRIPSLETSEDVGGKTFKIAGKGDNVKVFMDNQLIIDASGLLTNESLLKHIEYGDIDAKNENIAIFRYFRYSTDGAYGLDDNLDDKDIFYFSNVGTIEGGSIDYILGDLIAWTPNDTSESSKIIKFNENTEVSSLPTVTRNYSPITSIYIDDRRNKYIGTANGVTAIFGDKHDSDYEFSTSGNDVDISPEDFDRITNVGKTQWTLVEPNSRDGWFSIDTTYRTLGSIETQTGFATGDPYDPYKYAIRSHAVHYYSQRTHGHSWFDNVDNKKGWQVSFSFDLDALEADDYELQDIDKTGFGVYVNDGTRQEILYFYEDRIRLYYANVYVPIVTTTSRDYVITGKGDNLNIYQKLRSSSTATYSQVANASGLFTTPASISGNSQKPQIAIDSTGTHHAVWHDDGNRRSRILYSAFNGQSWSDAEPVTESMEFHMKNPSIAIDSQDRVWVSYEDTSWGMSEISVSVKDSGGWNPKVRVTNVKSDKGRPDIAVDTNDDVHLVWEDNRDGFYKIYWAMWSNTRQSWQSSGQHGEDQAIMQLSAWDEYQTSGAIDFKNPSLSLLDPYVYIVCEGIYSEENKSAIYKGFYDINESYWNTSGSVITDEDGEFQGWGLPSRVSDANRNCFNPSIAASSSRSSFVIAWEDRTEPVTQIWGSSYYVNSLELKSPQPITSHSENCITPSCGFVQDNCVILFEKNNSIYASSYNGVSNEFFSSYSGGLDALIDTSDRLCSRPAMPAYSQSTTFMITYDFRTDRTDGTLSSQEHPEFYSIGDATIDHSIAQTINVGPPVSYEFDYSTINISSSEISQPDSKEFAFGDFSENVGMIAHWKDFGMYFGYDAKPSSIVEYNTDTVMGWPENRINDIFVDTFGSIIVGTFAGLAYYNVASGRLTNIEGHVEGIFDPNVGCTSESCLLRTENNEAGKLVTSIKWGGNGVWFVGTTNGVYISQTAGRFWKTLDESSSGGASIEQKVINDMSVGKDGRAYIAAHEQGSSSGFIYVGAPGEDTVEIQMSTVIKTIEVDDNNIIWAGSDDGLWRIENYRNVLKFDKTNGMRSSHVNDISIVNKHLRYVATANGIEKMHGLKFTNLNVNSHNLINNNVNCVSWNENTKSLWVGALHTLHEIVFRDEAHEIIANETVHYDYSEISTEQSYDSNIYYILDPAAAESSQISSESTKVFINRNLIDFGYVVSESSVFFHTDLLVGDQVEIEISDRFTEFHDFNQKAIEKKVIGDKRSVITKIDRTSQNQYLFLSGGDKNGILLYSGESSLPFTTITLDTRPPEGCIELLENLSRTKVRFRIYAVDDRSGVDSYMLSNYPNFTSDGETLLDWSPIETIAEHDLGSGINNTYDSLSIPSIASIGASTYNVGSGSFLSSWLDESSNTVYLMAVTSAPIVVFLYDPVADEWSAIQELDSSDQTRVATGMKTIDNVVYVTTGSDVAGSDGGIWKCTDALSEAPFGRVGGTPGADYARGITSGSDQTVYFGSSNGAIYAYQNNSLTLLYENIGSTINSIDVFATTMVVGTGNDGRIYMINLETDDNLIIFDSSDDNVDHVHIKDSNLVTSSEQANIYAGLSDSTTIYRANMDKLDFVKSYSSFSKDINKLSSLDNITFEEDQSSGVSGTTTVSAIGDSLFKHAGSSWEFFYKHDENINDFVQYETAGLEGIWIISDSKITKWVASLSEKTVYLRLRDNAGNVSEIPSALDENGNVVVCPDAEGNPPTTCCSAYSIKIEDLKDFVHEGRIVDVNSDGDVIYTYESPNNRVFFSGNQIDEEVGIFESEILNGSNDLVSWQSISWESIEPDGTSVNVQVRSGITEDDITDSDWSANVVTGVNGEASLEHITDQYLQFKVILTSTIRDLSPSLSSVTIRNLTSQSSHFFTTNFVLPSRPIKGLLTSKTYMPVSSDVVFGINTKNSTDFGDYQIIEPNRLFSTVQGQFGSNLRIGAKLLSPGLPQISPSNNPGDPYDASSFVCNIEFDYENISGSSKDYHFRVRMYNDPFRTQLVHTFFTGNDQTGWSYDGGSSNTFPAGGLTINNGQTRTVSFEPLDEVDRDQRWYIDVDAKSTDSGSEYEIVVNDMSYICSSCNIAYSSGLVAEYYNIAGFVFEIPDFSLINPDYVVTDSTINFTEIGGPSEWVTSQGQTLTGFNYGFAVRWRGVLFISASGIYSFAMTSNDGSNLYIDKAKIISNDGVKSSMTSATGQVELSSGYHDIEVHYFQGGGSKGIILEWTPPGQNSEVIPAGNLMHVTLDEYCDIETPRIFNFIVQFELENGETEKINLNPTLS